MAGDHETPRPTGDGARTGRRGTLETSEGLDRLRRRSLLTAAGLPVSLLAPWYVERVSTPGLTGSRTITQRFTGWEALSGAGVACVIVAMTLWTLLLLRPRTTATLSAPPLGAEGRRTARTRRDGVFVTIGGALCVVELLWTVVAPPHAGSPGVTAATSTDLGWGVPLALAFGFTMVVLGVRMTAAAGRGLRGLDRPYIGMRAQARRRRAAPPSTQ